MRFILPSTTECRRASGSRSLTQASAFGKASANITCLPPLLMAANKGEPAIALALIEAGVAPGSPGYENHALVLSSVWFNGFNAPEKKTDYVRLVVFLLESAEHSGFFGHPPDYMNPSHNQALEEVLLVIGQRKRAGFEQQQLEEQLPTRGKAMRQERL